MIYVCFRLTQYERFAVKTACVLSPPDEECVPVVRLGGFPVNRKGDIIENWGGGIQQSGSDGNERCLRLLWVSFSGRTIVDHDPIMEIVETL